MFKKVNGLLVLPVLAIAIPGVALADGGGTTPIEAAPSIGLRINTHKPVWGDVVRVSGSRASRSRGRVTVWLQSSEGLRRSVGSSLPSRHGRWSVRFHATHGGVVGATQGAIATAASVRGGTRLLVGVHLAAKPAVALQAHSRVLVMGQVRPRGRWHWRIIRHTRTGDRQVASGTTSRSGRIVHRANAKRGDKFVLTVSSGGGLIGRSATTVVKRLRPALASWYGLYGEGLACGGTLGVNQIGVAHKTLKCGTKVTISYRGRTIVAPVIDRGPFIAGREFDLTGAAARALHFDGVDTVWVSP